MNSGWSVLGAAGLGAGLMYLLDPDAGRRRRKGIQDKAKHLANDAQDEVGKIGRDLRNRAQGIAAETRSMLHREEVFGERLAARVRSRLGRFASHPHAIDVSVEDGRVVLSGPVLASELDGLLAAVSKVSGVDRLDNRLEVFETAEGVPALQGGTPRSGERAEWLQENWAPGVRCLAMAAGSGLAAWGLRRRGVMGPVLAAAGLGLLARGVANRGICAMLGLGDGRHLEEGTAAAARARDEEAPAGPRGAAADEAPTSLH
jgi:hypothetical protein